MSEREKFEAWRDRHYPAIGSTDSAVMWGVWQAALVSREAEVEALRTALQKVSNVLGPTVPSCCGCHAEWRIALQTVEAALAARPGGEHG